MDALTLRIGEFEGPMDLLLHLIKEMKIDIYNIPIFILYSFHARNGIRSS